MLNLKKILKLTQTKSQLGNTSYVWEAEPWSRSYQHG